MNSLKPLRITFRSLETLRIINNESSVKEIVRWIMRGTKDGI